MAKETISASTTAGISMAINCGIADATITAATPTVITSIIIPMMSLAASCTPAVTGSMRLISSRCPSRLTAVATAGFMKHPKAMAAASTRVMSRGEPIWISSDSAAIASPISPWEDNVMYIMPAINGKIITLLRQLKA